MLLTSANMHLDHPGRKPTAENLGQNLRTKRINMAVKKSGRRKNVSRKHERAIPIGPNGTLSVPGGAGTAAVPIALRTKLRYFAIGTLTAGGANTYVETVFRSNSLYDPDFTGVGVQPAGFAALATLYLKYRVLGATVNLTLVNDSGGSTSVVMSQKAYSATYANIVAACTQGYARRAILSDQSGGKNQVTFRVKVKPWDCLGVTKERYMDDDQFASTVFTNPVMTSFLSLGIHALTVAASVQWQMDVIFDAVLFERAPLV